MDSKLNIDDLTDNEQEMLKKSYLKGKVFRWARAVIGIEPRFDLDTAQPWILCYDDGHTRTDKKRKMFIYSDFCRVAREDRLYLMDVRTRTEEKPSRVIMLNVYPGVELEFSRDEDNDIIIDFRKEK